VSYFTLRISISLMETIKDLYIIRLPGVLGVRWPSRLVGTEEENRVSTTIWSGGVAAGLYLDAGLILAFLVHTHYPGALGLREWIRVALSWPLIFFLRSKWRHALTERPTHLSPLSQSYLRFGFDRWCRRILALDPVP
jgi:hypothetical protein